MDKEQKDKLSKMTIELRKRMRGIQLKRDYLEDTNIDKNADHPYIKWLEDKHDMESDDEY